MIHGKKTHVYLNDHKLDFAYQMKFDVSVDKFGEVTLRFTPREIELETIINEDGTVEYHWYYKISKRDQENP